MAVRACQPKPSRIINATAMTCNQDTWWHIIESPEIRDDPVLHVVLQAVCKSVRQTLIQSKRWNSSIDTFVSEAFRQGHFNILLWIDKHCPGFMFRSFLPLTKSRRAHAVRRFFSTIGEYITDRNQVVWLLDRMRAHLKHSKRLTLWFKKLTVMEGVHELAHAFLARGRYDLFRYFFLEKKKKKFFFSAILNSRTQCNCRATLLRADKFTKVSEDGLRPSSRADCEQYWFLQRNEEEFKSPISLLSAVPQKHLLVQEPNSNEACSHSWRTCLAL